MWKSLESPDQPINLERAAEIAGLSVDTPRKRAQDGKLGTVRYAHERLTARQLFRAYLINHDDCQGGISSPFPDQYVPPDSEPEVLSASGKAIS